MITHRADYFGLLTGEAQCWSCKLQTPVAAILLDKHMTRFEEDEEWEVCHEPALLDRLAYLNPEALATYKALAPWVNFLPSQTAQETYWGNACTSCRVLQGDWYLHKPDAPFFPTTRSLEAALALTWHSAPLEASAGHVQASWLDRLVNRYPRL
jgi:hypothetical protein